MMTTASATAREVVVQMITAVLVAMVGIEGAAVYGVSSLRCCSLLQLLLLRRASITRRCRSHFSGDTSDSKCPTAIYLGISTSTVPGGMLSPSSEERVKL